MPLTRRLPLPAFTMQLAEHGDGEAVLCLHGFPEMGRYWWPLARALQGEPWRLLMPDLRGCGASTVPADADDYRVDTLVADVLALLDACGLRRIHLLGHDWGGVLAWWVAWRHPERVRSLSVCNAPHPHALQERLLGDPGQRAASAYISRLQASGAGRSLLAGGAPALWTRLRGPAQAGFDADDRAAWLAHWSRPGALDGATSWYRCSPFVLPPARHDASVRWHLPPSAWRIEVPTLLIWGQADTTFVPALADDSAALCHSARLLRWPGVGHNPPRDAPRALARALPPFWRAVALGQSAIDELFNTGTLDAIPPDGAVS